MKNRWIGLIKALLFYLYTTLAGAFFLIAASETPSKDTLVFTAGLMVAQFILKAALILIEGDPE